MIDDEYEPKLLNASSLARLAGLSNVTVWRLITDCNLHPSPFTAERLRQALRLNMPHDDVLYLLRRLHAADFVNAARVLRRVR